MLFASATFLFWFLPLFLGVYYLTPKRGRSWTLGLTSYVFYGWWRPDFLILMLTSTLVDHLCGRKIFAARREGGRGRNWLWLSLATNLGLLGWFKYANFGIDTLNEVLAVAGSGGFSMAEIVLPVGISFYTFQTLSYTIDIYRGQVEPVKRFGDFVCYVAMFPQLVAGPIVRYSTVAKQLFERTHTWDKFAAGVLAFQSGLVKKVLLADLLAPAADLVFAGGPVTTADAWIGSLAYSFQLYFDFSGYSDMAIGLGLMLGFRLPINFDRPYISQSITEFWRRWHISLSTWLRDYLYLPLGGNRKGGTRTYVNLALVMLIGGLWHGAAWTFLVWGAWHGGWLIIERWRGKRALHASMPRPMKVASTMLIVLLGWVFFRAQGLAHGTAIVGSLVGIGADASPIQGLLSPLLMIGTVLSIGVVYLAPTTQALILKQPRSWTFLLQLLFLLALTRLVNAEHVPFLYFQF
ncbi:MAG: MBOAT family protein [Planctomycetota bacterium]|nr:MBOAT family protein [Planctomycetota bacterium]